MRVNHACKTAWPHLWRMISVQSIEAATVNGSVVVVLRFMTELRG